MSQQLTPKGRLVRNLFIAAVVIGAVVAGIYFFIPKTKDGKIAVTPSATEADLVVAYNTFVGVAPLVKLNDGLEPNENSELYKKYGLKVQIKKIDVSEDVRNALQSGAIDLAYCTVDAFPTAMGSQSKLLESNVEVIMEVNQSHGADAIVARKGITKVSDLKGKTVAYAVGTASHTLLINTLETEGLTMKDITSKEVTDGIEAANAFKAGAVDAAAVWSPDDRDIVKEVQGSSILISTAVATGIIKDGLIAKREVAEKKYEDILKFMNAWLDANGRANSDKGYKEDALKAFAKAFDFPEDVALASGEGIYFSTINDNINFFELNPTFTGITGEKMYQRMAVKYTEAGLAKGVAAWRSVSNPKFVEELQKNQTFVSSASQKAYKGRQFEVATAAVKTQAAQASKVVSIEFPSNSAALDDDDKSVIEREIKDLAQAFEGAYLRVEGNTDNTGSTATNEKLSLERAKAVVRYLVNEYKFDENKFIVVGNGPNKPVADNSTEEGKAQNRRTEFQFIWQK
jgi:NitT/TauT family transport system substrate-binding protein